MTSETESPPRERPPECPRCGYDLGGQVAAWEGSCPLLGVCPECGLGFAWRDVVSSKFHLPSGSFEHATQRLVRAWIATAGRVALPWRQFRRIEMTHPIRWWRLILLTLVWLLPPQVFLSAFMGVAGYARASALRGYFAPGTRGLLSEAIFAGLLPQAWVFTKAQPPIIGDLWVFVPPMLVIIVMPAAFLCLFQTLGRLKIKRTHLARLWLYSVGPAMFLLTMSFNSVLVVSVSDKIGSWYIGGRAPFPYWYATVVTAPTTPAGLALCVSVSVVGYLLMPVWLAVFWWAGGRWYLKIPRALFVAVIMSVTSGLAAATVTAVWWMVMALLAL